VERNWQAWTNYTICKAAALLADPESLGETAIALSGRISNYTNRLSLDFRSFATFDDRSRWSAVTADVYVSGGVVGVSS
jgi:hypothetical protein